MTPELPATGWIVGSSMAMELDIALTALNGTWSIGGLTDNIRELLECTPDDWLAQMPNMIGESKNIVGILEFAADIAGVLVSADYAETTLAIRELTTEVALARVAEKANIVPDIHLPLTEQFISLAAQLYIQNYAALGFSGEPMNIRLHASMSRIARIWRDAELHSRFWQWLDQFYYACYQPWRQTQQPTLENLEKHALTVLGARESLSPPRTDWLPPQNCLMTFPDLLHVASTGQRRIFFLVEPVGVADLWTATPELLVTTFSEGGEVYKRFYQFVDDLATRMKALSDPTRLTILRLIRSFGMTNTEIADYLQLARPTVSIHAKILREAGLMHSEPDGRIMRHEIDSAALRQLLHDLEHFLDLPDES